MIPWTENPVMHTYDLRRWHLRADIFYLIHVYVLVAIKFELMHNHPVLNNRARRTRSSRKLSRYLYLC